MISTIKAFLKITLIVSLALSCRSLSVSSETSLKNTGGVEGVLQIAGTSTNIDSSDLIPVAAALAQSQYIALGEGSHGTIEFSSIRTRLAKVLVEDYGVRAIGFEMPWDNSNPVEKYIQTCNGNPPFFWWGQTEDLQRYLCNFNQRHPNDRVHIFGFDTNIYDGAISKLTSFVQDINNTQLNSVLPTLQTCKYTFPGNVPQTPSTSQLPSCISSLASAINLVGSHEQAFRAAVGEQRYGEAKILFDTLKWMNQDIQNKASSQTTINVRDAGMANLVPKWTQFYSPHGKVILWAENTHLQKKSSAVLSRYKLPQDQINQIRQALAQNPSTPIPSEIDINTMTYTKKEPVRMGEYLHDALGPAYASVATLGYDVSAASVKSRLDGTLDRTPVHTVAAAGSLQSLIHSRFGSATTFASFPNGIFDVSSMQVETVAGANDFSYLYIPNQQFDGVFFIDHVNATP